MATLIQSRFALKRSRSLGSITDTRLWLSFDPPSYYVRWSWPMFGRTYNGTVAGVVWMTPLFTMIGHVRDTARVLD